MEALLIMDADVIYLPDSLRRMTRHLADEEVGAVTAYIRIGAMRTSGGSRSCPICLASSISAP